MRVNSRCEDCDDKRRECEDRAARWIRQLCWIDEQLRFTLNLLDHHRKRNKRLAYIEQVREKLQWIIDEVQ